MFWEQICGHAQDQLLLAQTVESAIARYHLLEFSFLKPVRMTFKNSGNSSL